MGDGAIGWTTFSVIGSDVVRIGFRRPLGIPEKDSRDQIIEESRRQYCKPAHEVQKSIEQGGRWGDYSLTSGLSINKNVDSAELVCDGSEA